jgi:D-alanyl-D-alanine carboxypeptidase
MRLHGMSWAGISIGLTLQDESFGVVTDGYANVEAREPVRADHLFQVGSIGKSFTAIALLQLHEEGRLDLQAPVTEYLPWFSVGSEFDAITIHHLLTHTSGLYTGTEIAPDGAFDVWALREEEARFAPGTTFNYSNLGYRTLGFVLEAVTKSPYPDEIRARILEPLEMTATEPAITNEIRRRTAVGYTQMFDDRVHRRNSPLVPATWFVNATADGCISSTPDDMTRYLRMLMNRGRYSGGRLLSEEAFRLLTQPGAEREGRRYGYGVGTWEAHGHRHLGHGGGMIGHFCDMQADLDAGVGAIVLTNAPDFDVTEAIARDGLGVLRASVVRDLLPEVPGPVDRLSVDDPHQYEGSYGGLAGELSVRAEDRHLWIADGNQQALLEPLEPDQFVPRHSGLDRYRLRFHRDAGRIVEVTHGPREWRVAGVETDTHVAGRGQEPDSSWAAHPGHYRSFNPWAPDIRVFQREGELFLVLYPGGTEHRLIPAGPGRFAVGDDPAPHRVLFDASVDGRTLRATMSGAPYYRTSL